MNIQNFNDFYSQYLQLIDTLPKPPLHDSRCENCQWGDFNYNCKNLIYAFDNSGCQDSIYLNSSHLAVNCIDCLYAAESELCYESVDPFKCYNVHFTDYCARMRDSYYCINCHDSHNLFGCVNLKSKSYCIFNRQYSEKEYKQKIAELLKQSPREIFKKVDKLVETLPVTQTRISESENSDYCNHVHRSKNMYLCFDATDCQDCGYLYDSHKSRDSWDNIWSARNELSYQSINSVDLYDCAFINNCAQCRNSQFLNNCFNIKNCFGCVSLAGKEYCILNHQFSPEEYQKIVSKLKAEFKLSAPQIARW